MSELTPMMRQYNEIKARHPQEILFFRLGDFYEMFKEDAQEASKLLGLMLTHRHGEPMCGIPYHSAGTYIKKLLDHGKHIAICEQTTLPGQEKGLVKRDVVEVLTPGTVVEDSFLPNSGHNYICAFALLDNQILFSVLDTSTGDFKATILSSNIDFDDFKKEVRKFEPREILFPESLLNTQQKIFKWLEGFNNLKISPTADWLFNIENTTRVLLEHFEVGSLKGFLGNFNASIAMTSGFLLDYVKKFTKNNLRHIQNWEIYSEETYVFIDESSIVNLELVNSSRTEIGDFCLLKVIDQSKTAAGSRKLKAWLLNPLRDKEKILKRQSSVDFFYQNRELTQDFRKKLSECLDLERLTARLSMDKATPVDLRAIYFVIKTFQDLHESLSQQRPESDSFLSKNAVKELLEIQNEIASTIKEDPAINWNDGQIIMTGHNSELDYLRNLKNDQENILENYRIEEQNANGLNSLKLKFNKIIGYYFELTKSQLDKTPIGFIRKQSLVTSERYTTPRLEKLEGEILGSEEKVLELERNLFLSLRSKLKEKISVLALAAHWLAEIDAFQSLGHLAQKWGYSKPELSDFGPLSIQNGRHPTVERFVPHGTFIPNSLEIGQTHSFALITGPNMAGKSTYLRQNALIVILAQIGSFVPADSAIIPIVDKIFCRVGAADNLAKGESTFMVEMTETALILRKATINSLVIMDEVGRGTSTNDGLAIAWAISEYLLNNLCCKTLFATHFHELTLIEHNTLRNFSMDVEEDGDKVVFLRKIIPKASDNSYGLYVAQLAGVPQVVVSRAVQIQKEILQKERREVETIKQPLENSKFDQIALFSENEIFFNAVKSLNLDQTTPMDALNFLYKWKKLL